ncbi:hypothetical protein U8P80_26450 (plasmid) [Rhizobium beringeri]|uniref:hypothetical protein n=1 Tax=Rhizobium leguminosarum TaxID=384 RepID=UPI001F324274|nr:hypothetical protein [Rhizobium leguminosarum]UIJ83287.1 hypothetical protein LZK78_33020 [Rhizobium leguminosarum]WSG77231.1 hypothetical protein U8P80_26450 [Rhizobium beringeri]WSH17426.1 hypothetical protein U8P74_26450 [Rhizobium beringeri]
MTIDDQELLSRLQHALEGIGPDDCSSERARNIKDLVVKTLDTSIRFLTKENHVSAANDK